MGFRNNVGCTNDFAQQADSWEPVLSERRLRRMKYNCKGAGCMVGGTAMI